MRTIILCSLALCGLMACSKPSEPETGNTGTMAADPSKYLKDLNFLTASCIENGGDEESCTCASEKVARHTPEAVLKKYILMAANEDPDAFIETEFTNTETVQLADAFNIAANACDLLTE